MAKQLTDLPEHTRSGFPIREPLPNMLGICECGCGDAITSDYEYIEWSNMFFSDRAHVIQYLKYTDGLKEVG